MQVPTEPFCCVGFLSGSTWKTVQGPFLEVTPLAEAGLCPDEYVARVDPARRTLTVAKTCAALVSGTRFRYRAMTPLLEATVALA